MAQGLYNHATVPIEDDDDDAADGVDKADDE
jgi:hypothetical protein